MTYVLGAACVVLALWPRKARPAMEPLPPGDPAEKRISALIDHLCSELGETGAGWREDTDDE